MSDSGKGVFVIFNEAIEYHERADEFKHPDSNMVSQRWALRFWVTGSYSEDEADKEITQDYLYPVTSYSSSQLAKSEVVDNVRRTMCCAMLAGFLHGVQGLFAIKDREHTTIEREDVSLPMVADFMQLLDPNKKEVELTPESFEAILQYQNILYGTLKLIGYMCVYDCSVTNTDCDLLEAHDATVFEPDELREWLGFDKFVRENAVNYADRWSFAELMEETGLDGSGLEAR